MSNPSTAIQRTDLAMSRNEFSAYLNRKKFIGHLVFPFLAVGLQNSEFRVLPAEALITPIEDTERKMKAGYNRDDYEWDTDSYATVEHGVEEVVDDRELLLYGEFNAEDISRERAVNRIAQRYEYLAAAAAFDTAYFTGNYTIDVDATVDLGRSGAKWSVKASADPVADLDVARDQFITNCGHAPNALVLEETDLRYCLRTDRIENLVKYTGTLDMMTIRKLVPQLQEVFRLDKVIIAESPVKNTAGRGQTPTFSRMWGTGKGLLCRIDDGPSLDTIEPSLGRTIAWSPETGSLPGADSDGIGVFVEEYREEARRGGVIRARTDYIIKRLHKPAGLLLTNLS
jgi:hypothetical protein